MTKWQFFIGCACAVTVLSLPIQGHAESNTSSPQNTGTSASGTGTSASDSKTSVDSPPKDKQNTQEEWEKYESQLRGFGFGLALAAVIDVGSRERIESASLDSNGRVRVDADRNVRANLMLETHYFFMPEWDFPLGKCSDLLGWVAKDKWGWGPFVAVQPGSGKIIEAVGLGWMVGFKRPSLSMRIYDDKKPQPERVVDSFNLGIGVLIDLKQKVLGDGIRANELLPAGETVIRFRETSQIGLVVLFSYSFN